LAVGQPAGRDHGASRLGYLIVKFCVGLSNFIWLPVTGELSDRVGRKAAVAVVPLWQL
jgi:hypothetical protein